MTTSKVPADFPVQPLGPNENPKGRTTCGTCGRSWDDDKVTSWTPTPGGRCPFEYYHDESPTVIESKRYELNHNSSNLWGESSLKVIDDSCRYPKWLVIRAWNDFKRECKLRHIDWTHYRFLRICRDDNTWQIDFRDSPERDAAEFSLSGIYYDSRNKTILQRCFGM